MNSKKRNLWIALTIFIALVVMAGVGFAFTPEQPTEQINRVATGDIVIVNDFTVTSKVSDVWKQTYDSTFYGQIRNTTDHELTNVVITIKVQTSFLGIKDSYTCQCDSISANDYATLSETVTTDENFEKIIAVYCRVNNGVDVKLYEVVKVEQEFGVVDYLCGGCFLVGIIGVIVVAVKLRRYRYNIELELNQEPTQTSQVIFCRNCGTKNNINNNHCRECGTKLD